MRTTSWLSADADEVRARARRARTRRSPTPADRSSRRRRPRRSAIAVMSDRGQHADPHHGEGGALRGLAGVELVGGEGDRLGEQRAEVAGDHGDRGTATPSVLAARASITSGRRPPRRARPRRPAQRTGGSSGAERDHAAGEAGRQPVAQDLGDRAAGVGDGPLVALEGPGRGDEATRAAAASSTTTSSARRPGAVGGGLRGGASCGSGGARPLSRCRVGASSLVARRLLARGPLVGEREEPGEQRDGDEDEEHLVPTALVGERGHGRAVIRAPAGRPRRSRPPAHRPRPGDPHAPAPSEAGDRPVVGQHHRGDVAGEEGGQLHPPDPAA